jgi:hypothetical protein
LVRRPQPPTLTRSTPVPTVLASLEPDFFPVLLAQIEAKRSSTPAFARLMQAGSTEFDQSVLTAANDPAIPAQMSFEGGVYIPFVLVLIWAWRDDRKRAK